MDVFKTDGGKNRSAAEGGGICKKFHAKSCDFLSKDLKLACSFIWWLRDGRGAQKGVVMEC
jgi:hypothetical protein